MQNLEKQNIGNISKSLGISPRCLRYYEELGLIVPTRSEGGYREYSAKEREKVRIILKLKNLGLSLEDIQKIINLKKLTINSSSANELLSYLSESVDTFKQKVVEYTETIKELNNMIALIEHCSLCTKEREMLKCEKCLDQMPDLMKAII